MDPKHKGEWVQKCKGWMRAITIHETAAKPIGTEPNSIKLLKHKNIAEYFNAKQKLSGYQP